MWLELEEAEQVNIMKWPRKDSEEDGIPWLFITGWLPFVETAPRRGTVSLPL